MTGYTIVANPVEPQAGLRQVTVLATHPPVDPRQREPVPQVEVLDILHQPMVRAVTPGTVRPDRLLMDIRMATDTGNGYFLKNQGGMTVAAIRNHMFSCQRKVRGLVMIEKKGVG